MIRRVLFICILFTGFLSSTMFAGEPKSIGKHKNWEAFGYTHGKGKDCFAQTIQLERAPKNFKRVILSSFIKKWLKIITHMGYVLFNIMLEEAEVLLTPMFRKSNCAENRMPS